MHKLRLIGPFTQAVTLDGLPLKGPISDDQLEIIAHAGILVRGEKIEAVGPFRELKSLTPLVEPVEGEQVVMPGLVDSHTHICWAGSRAGDYAMRLAGKSYLEIAQQGGGIWSTVTHTRAAGKSVLSNLTADRANALLAKGVTTVEVKSGYGFDVLTKLKCWRPSVMPERLTAADLVPTCLAAHIKPKDFSGSEREYLQYILVNCFPVYGKIS